MKNTPPGDADAADRRPPSNAQTARVFVQAFRRSRALHRRPSEWLATLADGVSIRTIVSERFPFGAYPAVTLSMARQKREEAKAMLAREMDPSDEVRLAKSRKKREAANTFGLLADEMIERRAKAGLADTTLSKKRWLIDLARPSLGDRPIKRISAPEVLTVLRRIEDKGNHETGQAAADDHWRGLPLRRGYRAGRHGSNLRAAWSTDLTARSPHAGDNHSSRVRGPDPRHLELFWAIHRPWPG